MRALSGIFALVLPLSVLADEFHTLVTYACDAKADELIVEYKGAYNEAGERLRDQKGPDAWVPSDLRGWAPSDPRFSSPKTITRRCDLSDGSYELQVKPVPEDFRNIQGHCGDWETVQIRVLRDRQALADMQLDQSCYNKSAPVISKVVIRAKKGAPTVVKVSADDFYK